MRWFLVLFILSAGAAAAEDCVPPEFHEKTITGLVSFSECMIDKVSALERENAELRQVLERIEGRLAALPGELRIEKGLATRSGGENLVEATFVTEAFRREGPVAVDVDQKAIETLCADGCLVNLFLATEGFRKDDPGSINATVSCVLRYVANSGAWSQSGGCGEPVSGVDGDGRPMERTGGAVIGTAGEACFLADSEPRRAVSADAQFLDGDRAKGLHLIAVPALFTGTEARFRCEMKIAR